VAGRKGFVAGEILTAADVNSFLMDQAVMVFDDDTARGSAIPSPAEGMVTYLKDVNLVEVNNGTSFVPVGTILQVVSTTKTDTFSESVATGAISGDVTGLTVSITPNSASSKVFVSVAVSVGSENSQAILFRDGAATNFVGDADGVRKRVSQVSFGANAIGTNFLDSAGFVSFTYLDAPATTSATTYSLRLGHRASGTETVFVNRFFTDTDNARFARAASSITVMEVAG
jgi:hypothetical protein